MFKLGDRFTSKSHAFSVHRTSGVHANGGKLVQVVPSVGPGEDSSENCSSMLVALTEARQFYVQLAVWMIGTKYSVPLLFADANVIAKTLKQSLTTTDLC